MKSNVFYSNLNELCRKYLIIDQPLSAADIAAAEPTRKKVESEIFENLAIFDQVNFKVHGENIPLAVLIRLTGFEGFERLIDQDAIRFTLWTPMVAHLVDDVTGVDPLVFGNLNSSVHCDPEESIAKGLDALNPSLKPGERRTLTRKVRDLYRLPNKALAADAVKLTKSAYVNGKLRAYGFDHELKDYQQLALEERKELTTCAIELAEYMHLISNDMSSFSQAKYYEFFSLSQSRLASAEARVASLSTILRLDDFPDLGRAYHEAKDPFQKLIKVREHRSAREFRKWLGNVTESTQDAAELTKQYLDAIEEPKGFFQTKLGKFTKVICMTSIGAAIGHALGGIPEAVTGAAVAKTLEPMVDPALDMVDEFLLDGLLKGWTPRLFIEEMAERQLVQSRSERN